MQKYISEMIFSTHDHQIMEDSNSEIGITHYHVTVAGHGNRVFVSGTALRITGNNNEVYIYNDEDVLFTSSNNTLDGVQPVPEANMISMDDARKVW